MKHSYLLPFALLSLSSCVSPLTDAEKTPRVGGTRSEGVTVAVLDRREDVMSGKHKDTWEGLGHGVYGIPYFHNSRSGLSMAEYLATMIQRGFKATNRNAGIVKVAMGQSPENAKAQLRGRKALLIVLKNWYVDYGNTSIELFYDANVSVLSPEGAVLGSKHFEGSEVSEFGLMTSYYVQIEKAHKKRLEAILSDGAITQAL